MATTSANKFFSATGSSIQINYNSQGFGFYLDNDGTYYLEDGTPLLAVALDTGEYQEEDGTWYDNNGNAEDGDNGSVVGPTGNDVVTGGAVVNNGNATSSSSPSSGGFLSTLGSILGFGAKAITSNGSNGGTTVVPLNTTAPTATSNTMSIVLTTLGVGAVILIIVLVAKGGSPAESTPAPAATT